MKNNKALQASYFQKTYAGWLGKVIGVQLGSPIEGWTYEDIKKKYGEITGYLTDYQDYAADDDINGPRFFAQSLVDYPADTITSQEMGLTWLNYVPQYHGFFWWGGYGISTEHTAYENMKNGIAAPFSGSMEQNGAACAEQIGGQIFSDVWGFVFPGDPSKAADYSEKMARVSHDGEGVYGGRFVAACISAAYVLEDMEEVIKAGLAVIPAQSAYARLCREVMDFYHEDKKKDWHSCFRFLLENYGYDKYPGNCHIIPNAGVLILSLLYGRGDYTRTLCISCMCGWDTDCNAGNAGAVAGVLTGIEGIEDKWITPVKDLLISSSVLGGLNISTVSQTAQLFCSLGYQAAGQKVPQKWRGHLRRGEEQIHFDFKKSTGALRTRSNEEDRVVNIQNIAQGVREGHRGLKIHSPAMGKDSVVRAFIKTYYTPQDLHDSRYDPAFTPIVFPGQKVEAPLLNKSPFPVEARIFAHDLNNKKDYLSKPFLLESLPASLQYTLPEVHAGLIKELGLEFKAAGANPPPGDLHVCLDRISWSGPPVYNIDFSRERVEDFGHSRGTVHQEISQMTYLNGLWELDGDCYSGSAHREGESYTGLYSSRDSEISCTLIPQKGWFHLLNFRVQGALRSYGFGFYGQDQAALVKKEGHYQILKEVSFSYALKKEYRFTVRARGNQFDLLIDGTLVFRYQDSPQAYDYGQTGFSVLNASHCHFKDFRQGSV